jgi:hypothetical protein
MKEVTFNTVRCIFYDENMDGLFAGTHDLGYELGFIPKATAAALDAYMNMRFCFRDMVIEVFEGGDWRGVIRCVNHEQYFYNTKYLMCSRVNYGGFLHLPANSNVTEHMVRTFGPKPLQASPHEVRFLTGS